MGPRFRGNVTNVAADATAIGFAALSEADEEVHLRQGDNKHAARRVRSQCRLAMCARGDVARGV